MKTKEQILLENGYFKISGYIFDYEKPDNNTQHIIISRDEVENFYTKEPTDWYFAEHYDYAETLDDAWESFTDNYCCDNDLDLTDEELIKRLSDEKVK